MSLAGEACFKSLLAGDQAVFIAVGRYWWGLLPCPDRSNRLAGIPLPEQPTGGSEPALRLWPRTGWRVPAGTTFAGRSAGGFSSRSSGKVATAPPFPVEHSSALQALSAVPLPESVASDRTHTRTVSTQSARRSEQTGCCRKEGRKSDRAARGRWAVALADSPAGHSAPDRWSRRRSRTGGHSANRPRRR